MRLFGADLGNGRFGEAAPLSGTTGIGAGHPSPDSVTPCRGNTNVMHEQT
jgi:hypothetical protein